MTMAIAPSVSTRALVGQYVEWDGSPMVGDIEIALTYRVDVDADDVTIVPSGRVIELDADGRFRVVLPVSDDDDMTPNPVAYVIREPGCLGHKTITVPAGVGDLDIMNAPGTVIVPPELIGVALTGLSIGSVVTGAAGSMAEASISGLPPVPDLNLTIPKGDKGDRPVVTATASTGAAGSAVSLVWSGSGTAVNPYSLALTIPRGAVGSTGPSPVFGALSASGLAAGATPTVTKGGTGTAASPLTLAFGVPQGAKGDKGDKGDPGTVGPEVLDMLAAGAGTELREHFDGLPDGATPTNADTGQPMVDYEPFGGGNTFVIRNGRLTRLDHTVAMYGAYRIAELSRDVVRIGATFAFTPWTAHGGLLCLSIQETSIAENVAVPVSPMHLRLTPVDWAIDVNATAATEVEGVSSGTFREPLVADGVSLHTIEIIIDRQLGQCHLSLPNGAQVTLGDARFKLPGRFAYIEPFKGSSVDLPNQTEPLVKSWWADSNFDTAQGYRAANMSLWTPVSGFANGWQDYTTDFRQAQYRHVGEYVELRGLIRSGTINATAFTLPPWARPKAAEIFTSASYNTVGTVFVNPSGAIVPATGSNVYMSLSGIRFERG